VSVYRVYVLESDGRVATPPRVIECADDDHAISEARQYLDGKAVEVWRDASCVARLEPE
jgi:hypothetical protein